MDREKREEESLQRKIERERKEKQNKSIRDTNLRRKEDESHLILKKSGEKKLERMQELVRLEKKSKERTK